MLGRFPGQASCRSRILALVFVLAGVPAPRLAHAQSQPTIEQDLRALEDPQAGKRDAATRRLAARVDSKSLGVLLAKAESLPAETMRRVARALGRRSDLLGALARRLEEAGAGAGLAARALHEHVAAYSLPLPEDPDAVQVLPAGAIDLEGIASFVELVDALLAARRTSVPIVLEPSLALDGSPALRPWGRRRGAVALRHLLPPWQKGDSELRTRLLPRAFVIEGRGASAGSLPSLFVRSLAFFVSKRSPRALRTRAAITLGSLDLPTLEGCLRSEFAGDETLRDAATIGLAVTSLRGTSRVFVDEADALHVRVAKHAYGMLQRADARLVAAALRHSIARACAQATLPKWWSGQREDALRDPRFSALLATLAPHAWAADVDRLLGELDPAAEPRVLTHLALCARNVGKALAPKLVSRLRAISEAPSTDLRLLDAVLRVLDRRAGSWQGARATLPGPVQLWNENAARARAWGESFARREASGAVFEALARVEKPESGCYELLESGLESGCSWALWKAARARTRSKSLHDLMIGAVRFADPGEAEMVSAVFDRLRESTISGEAADRAFGRAYARCVLTFRGRHQGRSPAAWIVDLLASKRSLEVFRSCYRSILEARPLLARDILFELPKRSREMAPARRMQIPALLDSLTRERSTGARIVDPVDPIRSRS